MDTCFFLISVQLHSDSWLLNGYVMLCSDLLMPTGLLNLAMINASASTQTVVIAI